MRNCVLVFIMGHFNNEPNNEAKKNHAKHDILYGLYLLENEVILGPKS